MSLAIVIFVLHFLYVGLRVSFLLGLAVDDFLPGPELLPLLKNLVHSNLDLWQGRLGRHVCKLA
jgi:hypothetical protein